MGIEPKSGLVGLKIVIGWIGSVGMCAGWFVNLPVVSGSILGVTILGSDVLCSTRGDVLLASLELPRVGSPDATSWFVNLPDVSGSILGVTILGSDVLCSTRGDVLLASLELPRVGRPGVMGD
jgi:hypothetical protein